MHTKHELIQLIWGSKAPKNTWPVDAKGYLTTKSLHDAMYECVKLQRQCVDKLHRLTGALAMIESDLVQKEIEEQLQQKTKFLADVTVEITEQFTVETLTGVEAKSLAEKKVLELYPDSKVVGVDLDQMFEGGT